MRKILSKTLSKRTKHSQSGESKPGVAFDSVATRSDESPVIQKNFTMPDPKEVTGFLNHLTVTKTLGSGFSSVVKLAFDPVTCTQSALKILSLEEKSKNADLLFEDEVAALSNL